MAISSTSSVTSSDPIEWRSSLFPPAQGGGADITAGICIRPIPRGSLSNRVRRSIAMEVPWTDGDHVNVRISATILRIGIADLEHLGRFAGFIHQMMAVGVATFESGAVPGAQCFLAGVGDQC